MDIDAFDRAILQRLQDSAEFDVGTTHRKGHQERARHDEQQYDEQDSGAACGQVHSPGASSGG